MHPPRRGSLSALLCLLILCTPIHPGRALAQTPAAPPSDNTPATVARLTTLRDAFIARVRAAGYNCPLAAPRIVIEHVPSFGNYSPETNILHTADYALLSPPERAMFAQISGPDATEATVHQFFETTAHQWIFIHELGHWFQACVGAPAGSHYRSEYDANRISLAYWRETDPSVVTTLAPVFQAVLDHAPSPVPPGVSVEAYFDKNYEALGPSPAYPWFQSRMNVTAFAVAPPPSFAQVLASSAK